MTERVWVITGTSSGLGLAIAEYALAQGDKVRLFLDVLVISTFLIYYYAK